MKVTCTSREYSQKWDDKLSTLLKEGVPYKWDEYIITFKIEKSRTTKKVLFFWEKEVITYNYYEVWIAGKDYSYGYLYSFNGVTTTTYLEYSASQDTLDKLFELEQNLRYPMMEEAYN